MALGYTHRGRIDGAPGSSTAVSGPISVNANEVLAITVVTDSYTGTTASLYCYTTAPDWGFSQRVDYDEQIGGYAGVFALVTPASGGPWSPVIHVEVTGAAAGHRRPSFDIWSLTGVDLGNPVVQVGRTGFIGRNGQLVFVSGSAGHTLALIAAVDVLHNDAPYVYGDGVTPGFGFMQSGAAGPPGVSGFGTMVSWATAGATYFTGVNLGTGYPLEPTCLAAMMEFRAAPVAPTVDAGLDRTVERTKGIIRTAGEGSDGGAAITARQWRLMSGPGGSGAPVDLAAYGGDPKRCLLPNSVVGAHVIRYTATNSAGAGFDEATITVTALRPTVNAGPDQTIALTTAVTRTATEVAGDNAITSRLWTIYSGPSGAGTVLPSTPPGSATLVWTPTVLGQYVLKYTATSAAGTSDPDYATITVGVVGVPLNIGDGTVRLGVAIAFAGDLSDPDGSSWIYTEVTTDVRVAQGIYMRHGRSDEASASQPATCRFTLDNRQGKYSLGGRSPYWPNVRQGTPVTIYIDIGTGGGMEAVFTGYVDGFTPEYSINPLVNLTGKGDATVQVVASGALRRLGQGSPPVFSSMRRAMLKDPDVRAYWPCEDGKNAGFISSGIPGHPPMDFSGRLHDGSNPGLPAATPNLASSEPFDCSLALPQLNDSEWYGNVPIYTATNTICLWFLIDIPDSGSNDSAVLIGLITTGDPSFWEIRYKTGGVLNLRAWRSFSTLVGGLDTDLGFTLNGRRGLLSLELTTSGGNVAWNLQFIEEGTTFSGGASGTVTTGTVGRAVRVQTNTDGGHVQVTMGHIAVRSAARNIADAVARVNAHNSDQVGERLFRITAENLLPYTQNDGDVPVDTVTDQMGPQRPNTVLGILNECETCDQGLLWDGVDPGLQYSTKRYRESRAPALTLSVPAAKVAFPFVPVHDDQNRRNRVTANRQEGASAIYEDTTGPLGSTIIGRYDDSIDVNVELDSSMIYYAGWLVHTGTIEGYRWPRLGMDLAANPDLIDDWLPIDPTNPPHRKTIIPGDRVDVTGLDLVNASAPVEPISLGIEGFEQTITDSTWDVTLNTSPYYAWAVAQACATTGDTQEFGMRAETSGSTVAALIAAGQSVLSVATSSGPLWTTTADDFPLYLDVGGVRVRATACTGTSSPQTFTVDAMPVDKPATTPVKLWRQPVLGL